LKLNFGIDREVGRGVTRQKRANNLWAKRSKIYGLMAPKKG